MSLSFRLLLAGSVCGKKKFHFYLVCFDLVAFRQLMFISSSQATKIVVKWERTLIKFFRRTSDVEFGFPQKKSNIKLQILDSISVVLAAVNINPLTVVSNWKLWNPFENPSGHFHADDANRSSCFIRTKLSAYAQNFAYTQSTHCYGFVWIKCVSLQIFRNHVLWLQFVAINVRYFANEGTEWNQ